MSDSKQGSGMPEYAFPQDVQRVFDAIRQSGRHTATRGDMRR